MNFDIEAIKRLPIQKKRELLDLVRELEETKRVGLSRSDFMAFVKAVWPIFIEGRHHKIMANAFQRVADGKLKRLIINMPPRHDVALTELIPTTSGFKSIKDIAVGDRVFGPDGKSRLVTGKSPVNIKPTYMVTSSDGASLVVSKDHLWTVRFRCEVSAAYKTVSTEELYRRQTLHPNTSNTPKLPRLSPVQYERADLPIEPYVLGVWLGDGSSYGASIGCSYADMPAMRGQIEDCGFSTTTNSKYQQFNVLCLHKKLRLAGLLKNKHIPEIYLRASVGQRMSLLQGLIDTDGDVTIDGKITFNNSNEALIESVLCLIRSFGVKANSTSRQTSYNGKPSKPSFRISFKLGNAARISRKLSRCRPVNGNWSRTVRVEPTGKMEETQCLQVENDDGLFLAGRGYLVTHNTKSEFASYLLPAWYLGRFPQKKIIQASHTGDLAVGFGRKVRNLVDSSTYQHIFPNTMLSVDNKASGRWATAAGGEYYAVGVGGAVTGKGADLLIIDDPHSEQDAISGNASADTYNKAFEWYITGPRQRLQPKGSIIIVMTRWSTIDISGKLLKRSSAGDDYVSEWEVIEFPAIMPSGQPLWPEFWDLEELLKVKADISPSRWSAQYQQNPTADESAILKRDWWKRWPSSRPPKVEFIISSWDTAFLKTERANYSASTTWGVFQGGDPDKPTPMLILLDAWKDKVEFPDLKKEAKAQYMKWRPDMFIVETRAAGAPLIFELRAMGIPVNEFTPSRGQDKVVRANAVADLFRSGHVWAPETRWADDVIEECAAFPNGENDDFVDTVTQAMLKYRQGGMIRSDADYIEKQDKVYRRYAEYY